MARSIGTNAAHGTRTRYHGTRYIPGCRCAECTEANARYGREQRAKHPRFEFVRTGDLAVNCWCEATIVDVPPAELKAGLTRSCGARRCRQEPAA